MKPIEFELERTVPAPIDQVFARLVDIDELEAPHTVVFHWWQKSKRGKLTFEGWPSYSLEPSGEGATLVRHHAKLVPYGVWRLGRPVFRFLAVRERTITVNALKASFEPR
jgi:uncharacterized protein YndB with AHSA1/START domain